MADDQPPATPKDAEDIEALWLDPGLGDGITDTHWHQIPIGKPRNFFRVHPAKAFRRKTEIYVHKPEGAIEEQYYIIALAMRGKILEARPCVIVPCIYRDGSPRLWPIMFPRPGEKDNDAWTSARKVISEPRRPTGLRPRSGLEPASVFQRDGQARRRCGRHHPQHQSSDLPRCRGGAGKERD